MKSIFIIKSGFYMALAFLLLGIVVVGCNYWVVQSTKAKMFDKIIEIPENDVAIVLGTSPKISKRNQNPYFTSRINAAFDLYHSGKVKHLLLSGDNGRRGYNEPEEMKKALLKKGIPKSAITLDYAGFRTLDSIIRCKKVFQQQKITVISQAFHNHRALFIAGHSDIEAVAFNAHPVSTNRKKIIYREYLARVKVILDLFITKASPKFLGKKIDIEV